METAQLWTIICCNSFAKSYSVQHKSQFSKHMALGKREIKGTNKEAYSKSLYIQHACTKMPAYYFVVCVCVGETDKKHQ